MKKLFTLIMVIFITFSVFAQSPQKMSYQCVVRDAGGVLVTNHSIGIRTSILQGTPSGTVVYQETYNPNPQTNVNGLLSLEIGGGLVITGTLTTIDWGSGPYFLKTETDPTGGTNYTIVATSQLLSTPYALYSKTAGTADYNTLSNLPSLNIANWNTAYGWGNHAGLYRPISYVPAWTDVTGKPSFATVATSGSYNDLTNKPSLFNGTWASLTGKPTFATVATSGSYNDLTNKPNPVSVANINPTTTKGWSAGEYQIQTMASITMNIPEAGYVLLIHTGYVIFFNQGREIDAGIGTSSTSMTNYVTLGYLDGSSTLRYKIPYTVTSFVSVTAGSHTFYALGGGNATFSAGSLNMIPESFTGIFFP